MSFIVVIGDIHGMADKLRRLLSEIDKWLAFVNCKEPVRAHRGDKSDGFECDSKGKSPRLMSNQLSWRATMRQCSAEMRV
jgi:hypothetical protein